MKNACKINSDGTVSILLNTKDGPVLEAVVSAADYEKYAEPFAGTWTAYKHQRTGKKYARGWYRNPETGKNEQPMLHRQIMNPGKGEIIAHLDHNTLNCVPKNMVLMPIGADLATIIAELQDREDQAAEVDYLNTEAYQAELAAAEVEDRRLNGPGTEDYDGLPYACTTCGQIMYTAGNDGKCDACIAVEQREKAGDLQPVKGVSFHKTKKRWETGPTYEKVRYRLGYWAPEELAAANAAVTEFREIGPEAYFIIHPKKGGN